MSFGNPQILSSSGSDSIPTPDQYVDNSVPGVPQNYWPPSSSPASVVTDASASPKGLDSTGVVAGNPLVYDSGSGKFKVAAGTAAEPLVLSPNSPQTTSTIMEIGSTFTDISNVRPTATHWSFSAQPSSGPVSQTDFHALDLVVDAPAGSNVNDNCRIYAVEFNAQNSSANRMLLLVPFYSFLNNIGGGTIDDGWGIRIASQHLNASTSTITRGIKVEAPVIDAGSSVGTFYGVYVDNVRAAGAGGAKAATTPYSIYVAGGLAQFLDQVNISNNSLTTSGILLNVVQVATSNGRAVEIDNAGTGTGLYVHQTGANSSLVVDNNQNVTAVSLQKLGTGAGTAMLLINKGTGLTLDCQVGATPTSVVRITGLGSLVIGPGAALATNATDGFLYLPTSAGAPTGTPTTQTGSVAMEYDTTNNKLMVYNGSWKGVTLT